MLYNRANALAYARKYWTKTCSDKYIGKGNNANPPYEHFPNGATFVRPGADGAEDAVKPDGSTVPIAVLDDCAHFISCCIGNPPNDTGGDLDIKRDFPNGPYGILSARRLFDELKTKGLITVICEKASEAAAAPQLANLRAGDLIFYWNPAKATYGHVAMYMADAKKRISCHTYSRSDQTNETEQEWNSVADGAFTYTFAQVKDAAPVA